MKNLFKKIYNSKWFIVVLIFFGITARMVEYFINHTLWLDEAGLAITIIKLNYLELLKPLPYYGLVEPVIFVLVVKFFTKLWGYSEFIFRLFPLITGLGTLALSYPLGKNFLKTKAIPVFICLFAFSRFGIYYSREARQYSLELFVSVLLVLFSIYVFKSKFNIKKIIFLGIIGIFSIWCSYTSIFVLAGLGLALILEFIIDRKKYNYKSLISLLIIGFIWIINFFLDYFLIIKAERAGYSSVYWVNYFAPFPPNNLMELWWYPKNFFYVLNNPLGLTFYLNNPRNIPYFLIVFQYIIVISLIIFGTYSLWKDRKRFFLFIIYFPLIVLFIFTILKIYPIWGRLVLFILPMFYLLIAEGAIKLLEVFSKKIKYVGKSFGIIIIILFLIYPVGYSLLNMIKPEARNETKPAIEYYFSHRKPSDKVYIFPAPFDDPLYLYYTQYYFKDMGQKILINSKIEDNKEEYFSELKNNMKNNKVWIIFPSNTKPEKEILDFLNTIGQKKDEFSATATIYCYDFKK